MNDELDLDRAHVELLGLVAGASLAAFEQTAAAATRTDDVNHKLLLARLAAQRFTHLGMLTDELRDRGHEVADAVAPFTAALAGFDEHTRPDGFGEDLVRLCVVGGLVADFADGVRANLGERLAAVLDGSIDDGELADEPGRLLHELLAAEPESQGVLAMYARRLLGEAFSQAQRVCAAHPDLTGLVTGQGEGDDLAAIGDLMAELAGRHARRLAELGLG